MLYGLIQRCHTRQMCEQLAHGCYVMVGFEPSHKSDVLTIVQLLGLSVWWVCLICNAWV